MAKPQPDLTEFFKLSRPKKKPCQIGYAIDTGSINEAEAVQLDAACQTDKGIITAGAIQQWLAARNITVSNSAVVSHRTKACSCND